VCSVLRQSREIPRGTALAADGELRNHWRVKKTENLVLADYSQI
jgi:hypothetical protein